MGDPYECKYHFYDVLISRFKLNISFLGSKSGQRRRVDVNQ